jgi:hypothetical protein
MGYLQPLPSSLWLIIDAYGLGRHRHQTGSLALLCETARQPAARLHAGWSPGIAKADPAAARASANLVDLTGPQATAGLVDFIEQARALALSQRNQLLKNGLAPSIEGGQLLSPGKQLLIDDAKWAIERSLRILLGKTPIQRSGWHALSPESARRNMRLDSRQKCVRAAI